MSEEKIKTEKPKYKICSECGEKVKAQGYGGHLFLKHDIKIGMATKLNEVQDRLNKLEKKKGNPNPGTTEKLADGISIIEDGNVENIPDGLFQKFKLKLIEEERSIQKTIASLIENYVEDENNPGDEEDDDDDQDDEKNPDDQDDDDDEKNPDNPGPPGDPSCVDNPGEKSKLEKFLDKILPPWF